MDGLLESVVRGGKHFRDQPRAVGSPHLDFHQNKSLRFEYHSRVGPPRETNFTAGSILMGEWDNENSTFGKKSL